MGPRAQGQPGPACYIWEGIPTCTDADLVLGYLDRIILQEASSSQ